MEFGLALTPLPDIPKTDRQMTEDQIKAIAEEYIHDKEVHCSWHVINILRELVREAFIDAIDLIQKDYCIVKREKVMKAYRENSYFAENPMNPSDSYCQGVIYTLTNLFGTSMFNQDKE